MRKQTKLVAVASAAALLAIGASMTSFAATGWVEEAGQWFYYDKDGDRVEDEWKKSGDNWYWLASEEDGAMATDYLVEDGDYTYYVDSNGVMVRNTWVKMVNEDQDEETDPAEYRYYYFGSNGRAYTGRDDKIVKKTIDGKKYLFDTDGKMLYGWVDAEGKMVNTADSTEWESGLYYLGTWGEGDMKTGWQKISVYNGADDEYQDKWFYFNSNYTKFANDADETDELFDTKKINGKTYGFNEAGVMVSEWKIATGSTASAGNWSWFNSPEDGARMTKGWFKVVPHEDFDPKNNANNEDEAQWYYANGDGTLEAGKISKINGKYYAFNNEGAMMTGLVLLNVADDKTIVDIADTGVDADELSDIKEGTYTWKVGDTTFALADNDDYTLFYFGEGDDADVDGAMRTGNTTVKVDGDNYAFRFLTTDGIDFVRGGGFSGESKDVNYKNGIKVTAGSDEKYKVAKFDVDTATDAETFDSVVSGAKLRKDAKPDKDGVVKLGKYTSITYDKTGEKISYVTLKENVAATEAYRLIGTSGKAVKNKDGVKDGDDWYFYVNEDGIVEFYANSKNLQKAFDEKAAK